MKRSRDQSADSAEPAHLLRDRAARLLLPRPDALDERFAAELVPRRAFGLELLLDDDLRGDAGVVGADLPQRVVARIRCQRISTSISVCWNAWPMCSVPVTFGGGSGCSTAARPASIDGLK